MNEPNPYTPPRAPVTDTAEPEPELASLGARLGGAMIDGVLVALFVWPYLLRTDYFTLATAGDVGTSDLLKLSLVGMIVFLLLHGYLLHNYGQTIGKRLVGTRIVSATDNQIVPLGKIFALRFVPMQLISIVPVVGTIIPLIDVLFIFRDDRRCLHDLIAGTKVIKAR